VASITPSRSEVLLDNGVTLRVPREVSVNWEELARGPYVRASYRPMNGENVVTAMQVTPAPR
jgi:hypothetical protein